MKYRIVPFDVHFFRGYGSKKNCKKSFVYFLLNITQKCQFFVEKHFNNFSSLLKFFFMPIGVKRVQRV